MVLVMELMVKVEPPKGGWQCSRPLLLVDWIAAKVLDHAVFWSGVYCSRADAVVVVAMRSSSHSKHQSLTTANNCGNSYLYTSHVLKLRTPWSVPQLFPRAAPPGLPVATVETLHQYSKIPVLLRIPFNSS